MKFYQHTLASIVGLMLLQGCSDPSMDRDVQEKPNVRVISLKYKHRIDWSRTQNGLSAASLASLDKWMTDIQTNHSFKFYVQPVYGTDISLETIKQRSHYIRHLLAKFGAARERVTILPKIYDPKSSEGFVIVAKNFRARIPDCSERRYAVGDMRVDKDFPNHGCATLANLAQMLWSPGDLVEPIAASADEPGAIISPVDSHRGGASGGGGGSSGGTTTSAPTAAPTASAAQ